METKLIRCIEVGRSQAGQPIIHILAHNADGIEIYADDKDFVTIPKVFYKCDQTKDKCKAKSETYCQTFGLCHHTTEIDHAANFSKDEYGNYWEDE